METTIQEQLGKLTLNTVAPRLKLLSSTGRRKSHLLDLDGHTPGTQVPSSEIIRSISTRLTAAPIKRAFARALRSMP